MSLLFFLYLCRVGQKELFLLEEEKNKLFLKKKNRYDNN